MDRFVVKKLRLNFSGTSSLSTISSANLTSTASSSSSLPTPTAPPTSLTSFYDDKTIRKGKGRTFQNSWLKTFKWIEWDTPTDKIFCKICREANSKSVSNDLDINEDFIGFVTYTKAIALFKIVWTFFYDLNFQLTSYEVSAMMASNMSGEFKGLQKLITDLQPLATYIHCAAHLLNVAVEDSLRKLSVMRDTIRLSKDLINTIRAPKIINILKTINYDDKFSKSASTLSNKVDNEIKQQHFQTNNAL
ncbi:hypothetical protein J6590_058656 [Homalodisca vitripennis]|nr:hypothetical protein J6590_058656 [Homalodisca vitripennis]